MAWDSLLFSLPKIGAKLSNSINLKTTEEIANGFANILDTWPFICLTEHSRQIGFASGLFNISKTATSEEITKQSSERNKWVASVAAESFLEINRKIKVFKD